MRFSNEMKAGIVVIVAIVLSIFFFLRTSDFKATKYELKTYFVYAGDLKSDATVKLSGIEVGRVKKMKFIYKPETKVECLLEIDGNAKVRTDSIAYIGTAGIVGDAFVGITPGKAEEFMKKGGTLASEDPIQMRLLWKKADEIATNLDSIIADVKDVVAENKENMSNIIVNLEDTTENFKEFSEDVKKNPWKLLFKGEEK